MWGFISVCVLIKYTQCTLYIAMYKDALGDAMIKSIDSGEAWVAQSGKRPTSAQVMISQSVGSSPTSGSVLTARSLKPASHSVSPSLSAPPLLMLCLSLLQR